MRPTINSVEITAAYYSTCLQALASRKPRGVVIRRLRCEHLGDLRVDVVAKKERGLAAVSLSGTKLLTAEALFALSCVHELGALAAAFVFAAQRA